MNFSKTSKLTFIFLLTAYLFSIFMRYILIFKMQSDPTLFWNGELLITSPDGYAYAEGARDILANTVSNIHSRVTAPLAILTAFLVKYTPFSFETIIFYMPIFLSSLIVIPVFYITKRFGSNFLAFAAAIFASIVGSYYNRTTAGYYDTDMLIIVLPMFSYWFLIEALTKKSKLFALSAVISTLLYAQWLASDIALNLSIAVMVLLYTLLFDRRSLFNYLLFILITIAALPLAILIKLSLLVVLYALLYFHAKLNPKVSFSIFGILSLAAIALLVIYQDHYLHLVIQKFSYYFNKGEDIHNGLHFADSASAVLEAKTLSYVEFTKRISGHLFIFPIALIGYLIMVFRHKIMILFLPMLGFGFMSYGIPGFIPSAGLRFTIYATPVLAISLMYVIIWLDMHSKNMFHRNLYLKYILFILVMIPNILHITSYDGTSLLKKQDVVILDKLKSTINKGDYVISWWDYGYNLRYYAQAHTVCDGGLQLGQNLYPVSKLFIDSSQKTAANLAKLTTHEVAKNKGINYLYMMMRTYHIKNPKHFFEKVENSDLQIKENPFVTYIYIPQEMIDLYPVIDKFSRTSLKTGQIKASKKYFYKSKHPVDLNKGNIISIDQNILYMKNKQELYFKEKNLHMPLKKIIQLSYDANGQLKKHTNNTHNYKGYTLIILPNKKVIIADDIAFNSMLIQLGVLENYDRELFDPVIMTADAKVYRVK